MTKDTSVDYNGPIPRYIRPIAFLNIAIQIAFPISLAFTPAIVAQAAVKNQVTATQIYTLRPGESVQSVAARHGMTVDELKKINQLRKFSKPFETLSAGDEIDLPLENGQFADAVATNERAETDLARQASMVGGFLKNNPGNDALKDMARSTALSAVNAQADRQLSDWLQGKGKARIKLDADRDFSLKNSQLDLLYPVWEDNLHMVFVQGSLHRTDDRTQSNMGLGYRYFAENYALGVNTFYDHDWSRSHSRLGLGGEYKRDFLTLAANGYLRLSQWKDSPDFTNYEERPANGWDIRTEGYLPAFPGLGAKLVYEQYYGKNVGLFGKDHQQKNPHAITFGASYSPFPLLKFNADQRQGKGGQNDTRLGVELNYILGMSLARQLDSAELSASRTLSAGRYDFVDRNNNIVLEYRKKDSISLKLAQQVSGYSGERKALDVSISTTNGLQRIDWSAPELLNNGGQIIQESVDQVSVIVPEYQHGPEATNQYTITAVAYDKSGSASPQAQTTVIVTSAAVSAANSSLSPAEIKLPNDGQSKAQLTLVLQDNKGQPVTGVAEDIAMSITQSVRAESDASVSAFTADPAQPGTYLATLSAGTRTGIYTLTPEIQGIKIDPATAIIGKMVMLASGSVTVVANDAVADGVATNEVRAAVTDAFGNPVPDVNVTFNASDNASITTASVITDASGIATTKVTSTKSGSITVTATADDSSQSAEVNFKADVQSAEIAEGAFTVTADNAIADGSATNGVQVVVTDAKGNPVPDMEVSFSAPGDVSVGTPGVTTDDRGTATTTLTTIKAGAYTITAEVNGKSSTVQVTFEADSGSAGIADGAFTVTANNALADGNATNEVQVIVTDAKGNPVPGMEVSFSAPGDVSVGTPTVTTSALGMATTTLNTIKAGTYTITAEVNGKSSTVQVTFEADSGSAGIADGAFTVTADNAIADGQATNGVQVVVTDAKGNPVPDMEVSFSAPGDVSVGTPTVTTSALGVATTTLTTIKAGNYAITAEVNGRTSTVQVIFKPDSGSAEIADGAFTITADNALADGNAINEVQVIVTDAKGNPVPDMEVSFSAPGDVSVATPTVTTSALGEATTTLTSTKSGSQTITAEVNGRTSTVQVMFKSDRGSAGIADGDFTVTADNAIADGQATNDVQVVVTDAKGNPVSDMEVSFSAPDDVSVGTPGVTTDDRGIAITTLTTIKAGTYTITAEVNGKSSTVQVTFKPDRGSAGIASGAFTVTADNAIADGQATNGVQVVVTDAKGNPVPDMEVSFTAPASVSITQPTVATDALGMAVTTLTSIKSGSQTITAKVNGKTSTVQVMFKPDSASAGIASGQLQAVDNNAIADGKAANKVRAVVTDAHGNPVPDISVTFSASNSATVVTPVVKTDATGTAMTTLTSLTPGNSTVTAKANGTTQTTTVTFAVPPPFKANSSLVAEPTTIKADGKTASSLTLTIKDVNKKPLTGKKVGFKSSEPGAVISNVTEKGNGVYTAKLTSTRTGSTTPGAGKIVITATIDDKVIDVNEVTIDVERVYVSQSFTNRESITEQMITAALKSSESISYSTANGSWMSDISLPDSATKGEAVYISSEADQGTKIYFSGLSTIISKGTQTTFVYNGSAWVRY